mmetsp:Transcript_22064/g.50400  ORF Transcript_22064/g.50400 Transcript_22064/m.50400 type:complete len:200 (-) Transcript_22064:223-822(-)
MEGGTLPPPPPLRGAGSPRRSPPARAIHGQGPSDTGPALRPGPAEAGGGGSHAPRRTLRTQPRPRHAQPQAAPLAHHAGSGGGHVAALAREGDRRRRRGGARRGRRRGRAGAAGQQSLHAPACGVRLSSRRVVLSGERRHAPGPGHGAGGGGRSGHGVQRGGRERGKVREAVEGDRGGRGDHRQGCRQTCWISSRQGTV